ncbi:MAG: PIN domain protein [Aquificales bacterium]|nr:PIN domain protein [Aquificales bacterium]
MKIYLDNCMFNRPFDDQNYIRIQLETEAKLHIQEKIKNNEFELIWSYILDFENNQNPFNERRSAIQKWKDIASTDIEENQRLLQKAHEVANLGVKSKDALHIASAIAGEAVCFLTTDDKLQRKLADFDELRVLNPMDFIREYDDINN